jgi:hypothetical protein
MFSMKAGYTYFQISRIPKRTRCAKVFLHPVDPVRDDVPTYFQVIKHPVDLNLILKRLQNNEYAGISHWDKNQA